MVVVVVAAAAAVIDISRTAVCGVTWIWLVRCGLEKGPLAMELGYCLV